MIPTEAVSLSLTPLSPSLSLPTPSQCGPSGPPPRGQAPPPGIGLFRDLEREAKVEVAALKAAVVAAGGDPASLPISQDDIHYRLSCHALAEAHATPMVLYQMMLSPATLTDAAPFASATAGDADIHCTCAASRHAASLDFSLCCSRHT